jgi:hypothetical protein
MQMLVFSALLLTALSHEIVEDDDGTQWHSMTGIAHDVQLQEPGIELATIRRAVRSMERAGYIDVKRGCAIVSTETGRQVGHAQNLVRLSDHGYEYFRARHGGQR